MRTARFLIPFIVFLISCDAGTVDIRLKSFLKIEDATLPVFTDSIYVDVHDTLYLVLKDAIFYINGELSKDRIKIKFAKPEGHPVFLKDTIFLEHSSLIEVPPYVPLVINAESSGVYPSKVHLSGGTFEKSTLGIDTECDIGPLTIKGSYVELKMPVSCEVKFVPEKGAVLRGSIMISSLSIKRYRVDSATMYLFKKQDG